MPLKDDEFNAREPCDEGLLDIPENEQGVDAAVMKLLSSLKTPIARL